MNEAFLYGFIDELEKSAVYKPPGVPSLSSKMPGKIPRSRLGKLVGRIRPDVSKRMAVTKELKEYRKKGAPDERPPKKGLKGRMLDAINPLSGVLSGKRSERRRSAARHLAGKRSEAAGEPYARGAARQEQANAAGADRRMSKGLGTLIRKVQESQPGYVKKSKKGLEAHNAEFMDRLKSNLKKSQDPSDWWKRGEKPPGFGKKAGWGDVLQEAVKKHVKPSAEDAAGTLIEKGREKAKAALQDPDLVRKGVEAATAGGGEISKSPAAAGGKAYLKERGKGLLRRFGKKLQKLGE